MRKWLILTSYSVSSFIVGAACATLIPIPELGTSYFRINEAELTLYSYIFLVVSVSLAPFANWMIAKSLYWSMHFIWINLTIGCIVRVLAGRNFWISFIGQFIVSLSNMPVLIGCSSVATRWFPPSQVILVTSIAAASNFVGTGFSFLFMCFAQDVPLAFLYQAVVSSVFFIFNLIIGKKEKTSGEKIELKEEMKKSLKNKTLMILVVFVSIPMSVYFAYGSIIGILLEQQGFGEFTTGLMGFVVTGSGMIGAIPATYLADVKKSTKSSLRVFMVLTILSSIALSALIHVDYLNYIASAVFGASITGSLPLGIRACIEFMNDVHESIPTNLIYLFGQIFGSFLTYPIQYFFLVSGQSGLWIASLFILLSYSFLLIFTRKVRGSGFGKEGFNSHNKDLGNNEKNWGSPSIGQQLMCS